MSLRARDWARADEVDRWSNQVRAEQAQAIWV